MLYTIRYYRDEESALRYQMFGKLAKPAGWRNGKVRYDTRLKAQEDADHINRTWHPVKPVEAVVVT
jgi:hypothetical protein